METSETPYIKPYVSGIGKCSAWSSYIAKPPATQWGPNDNYSS